jgi:hypothetical protein
MGCVAFFVSRVRGFQASVGLNTERHALVVHHGAFRYVAAVTNVVTLVAKIVLSGVRRVALRPELGALVYRGAVADRGPVGVC